MAADDVHYLVVTGPPAAVRDFTNRIALVATRRVEGVTHRTTVPFSFASLYALAKISKGNPPAEPDDVKRWPIARRGHARLVASAFRRKGHVRRGREAEVRYRFHTRGLRLHPLLKTLSRALPRLSFALVTHRLDDGGFGAFYAKGGTLRGKWLGDRWHEPFWERAASQFNKTLEEVYDDEVISRTAEGWMLDEAVALATGSQLRYEWS